VVISSGHVGVDLGLMSFGMLVVLLLPELVASGAFFTVVPSALPLP